MITLFLIYAIFPWAIYLLIFTLWMIRKKPLQRIASFDFQRLGYKIKLKVW